MIQSEGCELTTGYSEVKVITNLGKGSPGGEAGVKA